MKHIAIVCTAFFATTTALFGQDISIPNNSNWRFGGNFGASIGNRSTGINIAPAIYYVVSSNFEIGSNVGYEYNKYDDYKFNLFSGGLFANYHIMPELFTNAHYEYYFGKRKTNNFSDDFKENALWIGAGYQSNGRVRFQTGIQYNLLYDEDKSVFSSPWRPFVGMSIAF